MGTTVTGVAFLDHYAFFGHVGRARVAIGEASPSRITSYNVCYTKLLRAIGHRADRLPVQPANVVAQRRQHPSDLPVAVALADMR